MPQIIMALNYYLHPCSYAVTCYSDTSVHCVSTVIMSEC